MPSQWPYLAVLGLAIGFLIYAGILSLPFVTSTWPYEDSAIAEQTYR
jgi:hypothetical protein